MDYGHGRLGGALQSVVHGQQASKHPIFRAPSNDDHERVAALFLGPKAENHELLRRCFDKIVWKQVEGRQAYFPEDPAFISGFQGQPAFDAKTKEIEDKLELLLRDLNKHSIPFYSPRYSAHMSVDQSLPAILGYLSTMFYNPNNVAFEASPFTTLIELQVGQELSQMLGYNVKSSENDAPVAWGHITCDGTVANLESIWACRNLKFYALSLREAMKPGRDLEFIADSFKITTCQGQAQLLSNCSTWEMLNLPVSEVVKISNRLQEEYNISSTFLESALNDYLIQSTGKDALMKAWEITEQPIIAVPSTKHYSWPKGAALAGIGSHNCIDIGVDEEARMDIGKLRTALIECATKKKAVYQVVAVIGTTEEGAVDCLEDIVRLRDEMIKDYGLSFAIHADAAWGGYFASMLPPSDSRDRTPYVPHVGLREKTVPHLRAMKDADSITIDPHKAGYVPYPAGGLCYKDGRMRYMVTWTAPYIDSGSTGESIGVYGVEGSKPGAAASAVYLAHQVIGTGNDGYGVLLGEASFTCRRFASHWAAMSDEKSPYIVVPMNRLPDEPEESTPDVIIPIKQLIRERILKVANEDLVADDEAMKVLNQLGSDLNINAFACNFRLKDGTVNKSVEEANRLNRRIFERLSVTSPDDPDEPLQIPFYVTSTTFAQKDYGVCAESFKKRLGLEGPQDLFVLRNVVMSPFSTTHNFVYDLADYFQSVLEEEVEIAQRRNEDTPGQHSFLVQGTDEVYLVHRPSFHMASGRRQIILSAHLAEEGMRKYLHAKESSPQSPAILFNEENMLLDDITDGKNFRARISFQDGQTEDIPVGVTNVKIIKKRSLDSEDFDSAYPTGMPFYLYGTPQQAHIDHMLLLAPNIQLSAGSVQLDLSNGATISPDELAKGVIVVAKRIFERSMQPFAIMKPSDVSNKFFFKKGLKFDVTVFRDPFPASTMDRISMEEVKEVLAEGSVTVLGDVYVDSDKLNDEEGIPARKTHIHHESRRPMSRKTKGDWIRTVNEMHEKMNTTRQSVSLATTSSSL